MTWYIAAQGQVHGPYDEGTIAGWIRAGSLPLDTQICVAGQEQWMPMASHPAFQAAMPAAAPPAAPPFQAPPPVPTMYRMPRPPGMESVGLTPAQAPSPAPDDVLEGFWKPVLYGAAVVLPCIGALGALLAGIVLSLSWKGTHPHKAAAIKQVGVNALLIGALLWGITYKLLHKPPLDNAAVAAQIKEGLGEKGITASSMECPEREQKAGDTFGCTGKSSEGSPLEVKVTQQDDQGNVKWSLVGIIIETPKLAASVAETIGKRVGSEVQVACPGKVAVIKIGGNIVCTLTAGRETAKLQITFTDDQGNITWKLLK